MANNRFTNLRRAKPAATAVTEDKSGKRGQTAKRESSADHPVGKIPAVESNNLFISQPAAEIVEVPAPPPATEQIKRGRPRAKRSDVGFAQATAYIKKDTYTAVRHLLLDQRKEYSVLVQELLEKWLAEHKQQ